MLNFLREAGLDISNFRDTLDNVGGYTTLEFPGEFSEDEFFEMTKSIPTDQVRVYPCFVHGSGEDSTGKAIVYKYAKNPRFSLRVKVAKTN